MLPLQSDSLWRIERGVVRTLAWTEAGSILTLGYWGPGDVVGQPLSRITPYEIECLTSVEASLVPPHLWYLVLDAIIMHTQQTEELMSILHQDRIPHRLLQLLDLLAQKFGHQVDQGQLIDIRLTHQQIADFASTTRITVTRMLKQLEQEGCIRRFRHQIILCHQNLQPLQR
jgi:CRP-like cAMP-binding protein